MIWKRVKKKFFNSPSEEGFDYIIIGLGNPGEKYKDTIHNVGFRVLSLLQQELNFTLFKKDKIVNGLVSEGCFDDKKVFLLAPLTFMNLSGDSVKKMFKKQSFDLERLVVVHDDTDLLAGTVRFCSSRGSAGHKGVESIIKAVKSKNFKRVRVGVKRKEEEGAIDVVLKKAPLFVREAEKKVVKEIKKGITEDFPTKTVELNN